MDEDLKIYLREMEERTGSLIAGELRSSEDRTAALIASELGGLHTEIQNLEKRMEARFDSVDARLKLHAGLIQAGARAMARFSENSEERWVDLGERVEALEKKLSGGNH